MANDPTTAAPGTESVRHDMANEARRLIDTARSEGLTLRLLGGLGVREHCRTFELCDRDYSDLDMVAPPSRRAGWRRCLTAPAMSRTSR
jgi:hypothetical protein